MKKLTALLLGVFGLVMTSRYHSQINVHDLHINLILWSLYILSTFGFTYGLCGAVTHFFDDKFED